MLKKMLPLLLICLPLHTVMAEPEQSREEREIEHLLNTIGSSNCSFIRNGKEHEAAEAESHLRMKYRRGKRWVSNAEQFIERLATESSWSGDPYQIKCPDQEALESGPWLTAELERYRAAQNP